jgi:hypothetical protein
MSYDVLIPYHEKDGSILPFCVQSIKEYAKGAATIYVVSAEDPDIEGVTWFPESRLPFTKDDVARFITCTKRIGWYYQQLIKLYLYDYLPTAAANVLLLDSDVILRKPITFFTSDNRICLAPNDEYNLPYFTHMNKLIPGLIKITPYSGVSHHMMTTREHLHKLLSHVERIHGRPAWIVFLEFVDPVYHDGSGMSEYEILFNYCLTNFPEAYVLRPLIIDNLSALSQINASTADMVAIHSWREYMTSEQILKSVSLE